MNKIALAMLASITLVEGTRKAGELGTEMYLALSAE